MERRISSASSNSSWAPGHASDTQVTRNITPRPIRATGTGDAHGQILDPDAGTMYVHVHREVGLAHRHYVVKPWQVRLLRVLMSRPMLVLYVVAFISWGWAAAQAARVPLLQLEVARLRADARRLDTLTVTITELQERYDRVQSLLRAATAGRTERAPEAKAPAAVRPRPDSAKPTVPVTPPADTTKPPSR